MARVKPKRHGVSLDMTAMCDVAFLLLTFFILTTKFKDPEVEPIKTPSSISETLLEDRGVITVGVTPDGRFYFTPNDNPSEKGQILQLMGDKNKMQFSDAERIAFVRTPSISVPMTKMKSFLNLPEEKRKAYKGGSIPMDSVDKELIDWVLMSRQANPEVILAIKGDQTSVFEKFKFLFEGLKEKEIFKFKLVTSQEGK